MLEVTTCTVAAGTYVIGDNQVMISRPAHSVDLKAFAIGQTTVTNMQFLAFVNAGGYGDESLWTAMGWRLLASKGEVRPSFWLDERFNAPDQPVVGVSWYESDAFARWLARESGLPWRLPTEVEWEAAARGPDGDAPSPRVYNTAEMRVGHPWAVTRMGNVSWCGAGDMCGNVWEWCSTRWGRNWQTHEFRYPYRDDGRENPTVSDARIMRGGSWFDARTEANPANRGRYLPGSRGSNIGFRLARSL